MSPTPLGVIASGRRAAASSFILSHANCVSYVNSKDNVGANGSNVTSHPDRKRSGASFVPIGVTPPTIVTGATPNGSRAIRFTSSASGLHVVNDARSPLWPMGDAVEVLFSSQFNTTSSAAINAWGDTENEWASTGGAPAWNGVRLSTGKVVTGYTLIATATSSRRPVAWTFEGSNDGSSWTTLDTRSGQTLATTEPGTSYTFSNSTSYTYYRINVSAVAGGGSNLVGIVKISLTGADVNGTMASSAEIWLVLKSTALGSRYPIYTPYSSDCRYPFTDGSIYTSIGSAARIIYTPTLDPTSAYRIYRITHAGNGTNTRKEYLDGVLQNTSNGTALTWVRRLVIGANATNGNITDADIAAVVMFNSTLSSGDAASVTSELQSEFF